MKSHVLILGATFILSTQAFAGETRPTTATPLTSQQKQKHRNVKKKQIVLKEKLENNASPQEIGKAKAEVQSERVEANKADVTEAAKAVPASKK
ncbi:MAG: hypothetical protein EOP05_02480 [Proteobacteria bacterium]|nr:MAG: hypothetical protein EOP05_02480 [Pseudomonadota bacterium]